MMQTDISQQIKNINECIEWVKQHKPADYDEKFLQLVEQRRRLKQVAEAELNNPGIAAFGMSQVGKSYLVNCLLKGNNKAFMVKAGDKVYNFSLDINPPSSFSGATESTGVVSRFSSYNRKSLLYNSDLPVVIKTFSLTDVIVILSDSYFNDIKYNSSLMDNDIILKGDEIKKQFASSNTVTVSNPLICADDVLFMKEYFKKHLNAAKKFVELNFFDKVASVIESVPVESYLSIFSFIWNSDGKGTGFNQLYDKIFGILREFDFAEYIYLPIDAVLHGGASHMTIMSVDCLKKLFGGDCGKTDVYICKNGEFIKKASDISKSAVSAICREAIFKIEDDFLSFSQRYDTSGMSAEIAKEFKEQDGNDRLVGMSMLRNNDLLDFPGARARLDNLDMSAVNTDGTNIENLMQCFLRGKVAYLFNQFNDKSIINILLFCHSHRDSNVSGLPKLVEDWVNNYVGATPEERMKKLESTKISPLFFISTMFNMDLDIKNDENVTESNRNEKWIKRFSVANSQTVLGRTVVDWINNYVKKTADNDGKFRNSYVLRDFKFSCPDYANIYEGWATTGKEERMLISEEHYRCLHDTFKENEFCKQFFKNPQLSFEVAATMNNDGSLYILENLKTAAENIGKARENDFQKVCNDVAVYVNAVMRQYYVPEDTDEKLIENLRKANEIRNDLLIAKHDEFYYFGVLLRKLQISESEIFNKLKTEILGNLHDMVFSFKDNYSKILKETNHFEGCKSEEEKWKRFLDSFKFDGNTYEEQKKNAIEYLNSHNIDQNKLFAAEVDKHINSAVIAREILKRWEEKISALERTYDGVTIGYLIQCYKSVAKSLDLQGQIEEEIAPYTDIPTGQITQVDLIADIISTIINKFVLNFGYDRLDQKQKDNASKHVSDLRYRCFDYLDKQRKEDYSEEEMTEFFNKYLVSDGSDIPSTDNTQQKWLAYMFMAFVANLDAADYDKVANDKLKQLLDKINA